MSSLSPVTFQNGPPSGVGPPLPPPSSTSKAPLPTQQLNLSTYPKAALGQTTFPPTELTSAGATAPPAARFGASFLSSVLPTNQAPVVSSTFTQAPATQPGAPTGVGGNEFNASYAPQIYAVFLNGLISQETVDSATILVARNSFDQANPPISGDPPPLIPGLPPTAPYPARSDPAGTDVVSSLQALAGSGSIFPQGSAPTPAPAPAPTPAPAPAPAAAAPAPAKAA